MVTAKVIVTGRVMVSIVIVMVMVIVIVAVTVIVIVVGLVFVTDFKLVCRWFPRSSARSVPPRWPRRWARSLPRRCGHGLGVQGVNLRLSFLLRGFPGFHGVCAGVIESSSRSQLIFKRLPTSFRVLRF